MPPAGAGLVQPPLEVEKEDEENVQTRNNAACARDHVFYGTC